MEPEKIKRIDLLLRQLDGGEDFDKALKKIPVEISGLEIEGLKIHKGSYPDLDPFKGRYTAKLEIVLKEMKWGRRTYSFGYIKEAGIKKLLEKREQTDLSLYDFSGKQLLDYGAYSVVGNKQLYERIYFPLHDFPLSIAKQVALSSFTKEKVAGR